MLENLGYQVVGMSDPSAALERFQKDKDAFDLVITDKTMPQMTGFGLAQAIKRIQPDIPILLCTGFYEIKDTEKARSVGVKTIVAKPLDKQSLAEAVRKILDEEGDEKKVGLAVTPEPRRRLVSL